MLLPLIVMGLQSWLLINNPLVPDFIVKDPKEAPVWEIVGMRIQICTCQLVKKGVN